MENYVECKNCKHFDGKMKCTLFCEEVYPDYIRYCSEFDARKATAMTKCGDCIHYANRDCPVGNGNTTADHICECAFYHSAGDSKKAEADAVKHECGTCFWYNDTCHNKQSRCYTIYRKDHDSCEWWEFANSEAQQSNDTVNHPNHYTQGGIECVDAMKACVSGLNEMEAACTSHALKYLWRWKHKNGAEDIRKCIWWLERLLKEIGDEQPVP